MYLSYDSFLVLSKFTHLNFETPREAIGASRNDISALLAFDIGVHAIRMAKRRSRSSALPSAEVFTVDTESQKEDEEGPTPRHLPDKMRLKSAEGNTKLSIKASTTFEI